MSYNLILDRPAIQDLLILAEAHATAKKDCLHTFRVKMLESTMQLTGSDPFIAQVFCEAMRGGYPALDAGYQKVLDRM